MRKSEHIFRYPSWQRLIFYRSGPCFASKSNLYRVCRKQLWKWPKVGCTVIMNSCMNGGFVWQLHVWMLSGELIAFVLIRLYFSTGIVSLNKKRKPNRLESFLWFCFLLPTINFGVYLCWVHRQTRRPGLIIYNNVVAKTEKPYSKNVSCYLLSNGISCGIIILN